MKNLGEFIERHLVVGGTGFTVPLDMTLAIQFTDGDISEYPNLAKCIFYPRECGLEIEQPTNSPFMNDGFLIFQWDYILSLCLQEYDEGEGIDNDIK